MNNATIITYVKLYPIVLSKSLKYELEGTYICNKRIKHLPSKKTVESCIKTAVHNGCPGIEFIGDTNICSSIYSLKTLRYYGFHTFEEYLISLCKMCICNEPFNLIPILNIGTIPYINLKQLKNYIGHIELLFTSEEIKLIRRYDELEDTNCNKQIKNTLLYAGKMGIPLTIKINLGTEFDNGDMLYFLNLMKAISKNFHNLQSVEFFEESKIHLSPNLYEKYFYTTLLGTIHTAYTVLPKEVTIQYTPPHFDVDIINLLKAGVRDLGNLFSPGGEKCDSFIDKIRQNLLTHNIILIERLPIYNYFIKKGMFPPELNAVIKTHIQRLKEKPLVNHQAA